MEATADRAIAIVGLGAVLPEAPNAAAFWQNILNKRYSIKQVPANRWRAEDYYHPDISAPDKTYSLLGGWVENFSFDWKKFHIPPKVAAAMDQGQQWALTIADMALADYGYPQRPLNTERTAVIMGTAMGGELHYQTFLRAAFPEYARALEHVEDFQQLPAEMRERIRQRWHELAVNDMPPITEDSMPGELPNIISGRIANVLNLQGPNFITDAACAASFAAVNAAVELLTEHHVDAVVTGGVDRNMGVATFIKFCKIGALSATGSRPFGEGADGFVMGEGSAAFVLKRLEDAERAGDRIYAVIRGVGGSSDGKGKGITAPNPQGQQLAVQRAWENAGLDPSTATLVEAHGTSTRVGDVVEVESLSKIYGGAPRSIGLGSVKSNIGHLKAGAGAAGLLKATLAVHNKILPPTLNSERPNPNIDFSRTPFYLLHEPRQWPANNGTPRRAGVSAYGFGGTNFHVVLEEHIPGRLTSDKRTFAAAALPTASTPVTQPVHVQPSSVAASFAATPRAQVPLRGILALGANTPNELKNKLDDVLKRVETGWTPPLALPSPVDVSAQERLVIDYGTHDELLHRLHIAQKAMGFDSLYAWKTFQAQGIFRGSGARPGKVAFMFPGQGSQYLNMGRELAARSPIVAEAFAEADRIMTPILEKPLTSFIFIDDEDTLQAEINLMQTAITQPAVLTLDIAILRLLQSYGFRPDVVMGHSLGEYAALIAAGVMRFTDALEAAAARGSEMSKVSVADNGAMAAVLAPYDVIEDVLKQVEGYVVPANINSHKQCVIGGESHAVEQAIQLFTQRGYKALQIPVSHAFHTRIVASASAPLRQVLDRLPITEPRLPLVANVTGDFYPTTPDTIKDMLQLQIASPVQWVKGLQTLYRAGVRTFVEVGPKRALKGFADDVFSEVPEVLSLLTNHPKTGELPSFNQALCGLYAAGYFMEPAAVTPPAEVITPAHEELDEVDMANVTQMLVQAIQQASAQSRQPQAFDRDELPRGSVVISGTGLGLPGAEKTLMDPDNAARILHGEQFIDLIPERFRKKMLAKHVTRLVKSEDGNNRFEVITDPDEVIKLAGRPGAFDLEEEYGVPAKLIEALDMTTQLGMAAGLDALREAGIPLVQTYRATTTGKHLPERWMLPESLRDETGVIFASAFPGGDRFAEEISNYYTYQNRVDQLTMLEDLRLYTTDGRTLNEINRRVSELRETLEREPYEFDRRFIFRVLAMGHSQFAEYIGARGPNTHVNAACASTTQAIALAEDWIRSGRCRRVIVLGADDVTSDHLMEWIGAGFLATGAAATDDRVEEAALPFDRRRHGTILGMGACALVVESEDCVRERGMRGIVEVLSTETRNSAYHGTRLDVNHIALIMDALLTSAERRFGLHRQAIAPQTVFMSHETFTPARGGSASAEVVALRHTFGDAAKEIIVANTKGFTGHPMGVGVEDVIALKILEHGIVPPVPNYKEVDPELGELNLSRGGRYPVQYVLHLSAGFGSQIAMALTRRIPGALERVDNGLQYQRWLDSISGYDRAELEVQKRVLRIKAVGVPLRTPAANQWQYGTGPTVRARAAEGGAAVDYPAHRMTVPQTAPQTTPKPISRPAVPPAPVAAPPPPPAPVPTPVETRTVNVPVPAPQPVPAAARVEPPVVIKDVPLSVPPVPAPTLNGYDSVTSRVLEIVAAQTGYPTDMLELDLDLEADLGVDTVKQAETFAAIRKEFDIPRREDLKLRDYPTLRRVVAFVHEMRPELAVAPVKAAPAVVSAPAAPVQNGYDEVTAKVLEIVAAQTGYPTDMLELDLDLEADLGVDTVKQAETFAAIRKEFDIPRREDLKLRDYPTLRRVVAFVHEMRPELAVAPVKAAPAVVSAPVAPAALPVQNGYDEVTAKVLEIVAAQTGYPTDMLELDLDLEADLGVDTVKQAETFAAIRKEFDIPRREDLKLRDYPTLRRVVAFVREMRPELAIAPVKAAPAVVSTPAAPAVAPVQNGYDEVTAKVLAIVAAQTGYPTDMLELDLDLEADLGVDTVKQAETFAAIRKEFDIPRREDLKLRDYPTLRRVVAFVRQMRPELAVETVNVQGAPVTVNEPAAAPAPVQNGYDEVTAKVLEIVAAQTGYPTDMLELDLDLEADLGVDTVKQAETFAAIRKEFDIPRREDLKLRDYPTLRRVVAFVHEMRPDLAGGAVSVPFVKAESKKAAAPAPRSLGGTLQDADLIPRRVPVAAVRPPLALCKPTGVTLDEHSRVIVMADSGGVGKALIDRLQKRGVTVLAFASSSLSTEEAQAQVQMWLECGSVQGVYWLPALDVEPALETLELATWRELNRQRVKNLYHVGRMLYEQMNVSGAFLVSATRLGGLHGYGADGASAPLGGAVVGFTKAYKRERGTALVKAVDFEVSRKTAAYADALIAETLVDPGVVEVGYRGEQRHSVTLIEQPVDYSQPKMTFDQNSVFVVTGAAGGITSAIVQDLAAASGGIFYLLDLAPLPQANDPLVRLFRESRDALKTKLIEDARASGEKLTPVQIDKRIASIEREEAALRAVEAVEAYGGTAHYYSVNLLDGERVTQIIDDIRARHGRIDALVHAGGLEISRSLPDKDPAQFDLVFDVKADGFFSLLRAAQGMPIGVAVVFSSVAGRFGNNGQTDYSAANDLLCKLTSSFKVWRPETRGIAIDWTAWGGIGMATRGSIPKIMEMAGIEMLPPVSGIPTVRRELLAGGGEIVVGSKLGILVDEWDETGGLDVTKVAGTLMAANVKGAFLYGGLHIETTLDPKAQPFLYDHALEGTPLLPGVMGTETFAQAAKLLAPGYQVAAVMHERFDSPFKFYRMEHQALYITVQMELALDGALLAYGTLSSRRQLANGTVQEKRHFTAEILLTSDTLETPVVSFNMPPSLPISAEQIYRIYFHGPAYQVLAGAVVDGDHAIGLMAQPLPAETTPQEATLVMQPRLIELCFQTAGVWEIKTKGVMALPLALEAVTAYRVPDGTTALYAVVNAVEGGVQFDAIVVDEQGNVYVELRGYRTVQLPGEVTL